MTGFQTKDKRIIAIFLTISVVIFCVFWQEGELCSGEIAAGGAAENGRCVFYAASSYSPDFFRGLDNPLPDSLRRAEEMERMAESCGYRVAFCDLFYVLFGALLFMTVAILSLLTKSDMTPRYSVILYIHRSDGEKPGLGFPVDSLKK